VRAIETTTSLRMGAAEAAVREALASQGFGILTEIDMAATLKAKLGVERAPLKILGACNPTFAHRALELDESASLVLPCNVVLADTGNGTKISAADPREFMTGHAFEELANDAADRLTAALAAVLGRGSGDLLAGCRRSALRRRAGGSCGRCRAACGRRARRA
jgi:uncharacterized protein (DUF302 family)